MEEIFLVLYHKSNYDCLKQLVNLIDVLKQNNKKFIISSHSPLPNDIIEETVAYVYDKDNILLETEPLHNYFVSLQNSVIYSPFVHYGVYTDKNYGLSAIKNIITGLNLAYYLGYDIVHSIEYDHIPDFNELQDNFNIINEDQHSAVVYKLGDYMMGSVFTTKVNKPQNRWIKEHLEKEYKNNYYISESILLDILKKYHNNNIKIKPHNDDFAGKITSFHISNSLESAIVEHNGILNLFLRNSNKNDINKLEILTSLGKIKTSLISEHYRFLELGPKENITYVDIIDDHKIYKKWDISTEENYNKYVKPNRIEIRND